MKTRKAFTLVEIMLVIVIISVVAIIALPSYISSQNKARVGNTATNLVSELKEWQNKAMAGWTVLDPNKTGEIGQDGATADQTVLPEGLGVTINKLGDVTAFADLNGDKMSNEDLTEFLGKLDDSFTVRIESDLGDRGTVTVYFESSTGEISLYGNDVNDELKYAKITTSIWDLGDEEVADHLVEALAKQTVIEAGRSSVYVCDNRTASTYCDY